MERPVIIKTNPELPKPAERKRLRTGAGISSTDLASMIGVSVGSIHHWEAGTREPRGLQRRAYALALSDLSRADEAKGTG